MSLILVPFDNLLVFHSNNISIFTVSEILALILQKFKTSCDHKITEL